LILARFVKAQGQQESRSGGVGHPGFLPFALWFIVPNKCEHRNNLSRVHRLLMRMPEKAPSSGWAVMVFYFSATMVFIFPQLSLYLS
jgi:hypothetical protein